MKKLVGPLALALAILIADRASKLWVLQHVTAWDIWPIIPGFMNIIHAENPGMAFSLLSTASESTRAFVLIGLATVVLSVVAVMLWRSTGTAERWGPCARTGRSGRQPVGPDRPRNGDGFRRRLLRRLALGHL
jgi:lipoprotein signal peptidase